MPAPDHCSDQPTDPLDIQPESDISGFGVFVGFVSASYVMLVIVIIYYIFGYDPALNPFGVAENSTPTRTRPNPFDQLVLRVARWILRIDATKWQASYKDGRFAAAFDKCVISMADIQMVNGLAILIAGLVLLPQRLSALHWKMVVYLAWFSCTTNLSALTFLRPHMIRSTFERVWRLGSAFVLLVALVVCLIPTGHFFWLTDSQGHREDAAPSAYAICYFNVEYRGDSFTGKNSMLLSILLLVFSYAVRILKLYRGFTCRGPTARPLSDFLVNGCLKSAARLQGMIGTSSFAERMASNLIVAAHFVVCLWIDISTSMASDIFWLIISMTWGSQRTAELRGILDASPAADADPKWSFGQILAVLLVIGPLLGLVRSGRDMFTSILSDLIATVASKKESRPDTSQPAAEGDISRSSGRSDPGVLDPNLFTEYCKKSAWMGWAPAICLSYTLPAANRARYFSNTS
ncbi:hypothetical protein GGR52DRAFT_581534 [Hypoxylon sp. FL1284]|nr:hypothetical protein GGR52DRAFT_581534 [Hypoxylon sp. FL1284]